MSKLGPWGEVEGISSGAMRNGARVGLRETEAAGFGYIDYLATGDFDILRIR